MPVRTSARGFALCATRPLVSVAVLGAAAAFEAAFDLRRSAQDLGAARGDDDGFSCSSDVTFSVGGSLAASAVSGFDGSAARVVSSFAGWRGVPEVAGTTGTMGTTGTAGFDVFDCD